MRRIEWYKIYPILIARSQDISLGHNTPPGHNTPFYLINNKVLLPRAEYRLQTTFLSRKKCEKLQRPFLRILKQKSGLALNTPNSILSHRNIVGVQFL